MFSEAQLIKEFNFKGIRSSGSGGQHVNKVSSKVELSFNVEASSVLSQEQKTLILEKLSNRLTKDGILILQCGESRSQHRNKNIVIVRTIQFLKSALILQKKRIRTKVPKAVVLKRLKNKRISSQRKASRRKPDID